MDVIGVFYIYNRPVIEVEVETVVTSPRATTKVAVAVSVLQAARIGLSALNTVLMTCPFISHLYPLVVNPETLYEDRPDHHPRLKISNVLIYTHLHVCCACQLWDLPERMSTN